MEGGVRPCCYTVMRSLKTKGRKGERYGFFCFGDMAWLFKIFFLLFAIFVYRGLHDCSQLVLGLLRLLRRLLLLCAPSLLGPQLGMVRLCVRRLAGHLLLRGSALTFSS